MRNLRFMIQKPFFSPEITAIANKIAITADYPVAGNYNAYLIAAVCSANSTDCFCIINPFGKCQIADMFPIRDIHQLVPYLSLKIRTTESKPQVKIFSFTGKILVQLLYAFFNNGRLRNGVIQFIFINRIALP